MEIFSYIMVSTSGKMMNFKKRIKTNNLEKIGKEEKKQANLEKQNGMSMSSSFHFQARKEQAEPNVWVKMFRKNWVCKHNQKCHKRERKGLIIWGHKTKQPGHLISLNSFTCYSSCLIPSYSFKAGNKYRCPQNLSLFNAISLWQSA